MKKVFFILFAVSLSFAAQEESEAKIPNILAFAQYSDAVAPERHKEFRERLQQAADEHGYIKATDAQAIYELFQGPAPSLPNCTAQNNCTNGFRMD